MLIRAFNACVRLPIFSWYFSVEREQGSSLFVSATTSIIKKHQFVIMEAEKIRTIETVGAIFSFNRAGWSVSMVAFGDRKDFLQFLRMWHFRRKCHMRKTCKKDAGRGRASACTGLLLPQFEKLWDPVRADGSCGSTVIQ